MTLLYYFAFLLVELLFFLFADLFFEAAGCNKRGERMEWSKLPGLEKLRWEDTPSVHRACDQSLLLELSDL